MRKFILYGAASIGGIAKDVLESCGYDVLGYIDKRAYEIEQYNDLPVWSIQNILEIDFDEDIVVFIAVKNVFEHEKIARMLIKAGVQNLIYKPYHVLLGNATPEENMLAQLYDDLFEGRLKGEEFEIPNCGLKEGLYDYALISKEDGYATAYIPVEYIFTNDYRDGEMQKWGNIPIMCFFTHINFFRSLDGDQDCSVIPYLKEYCEFTAKIEGKIEITDAWRDNVIANRTHIYEQMNESLYLDPFFFVRNAATANWNREKKYFNLTSGKHRCAFLAAKGNKYVPLTITDRDYEDFLNQSKVNQIKELLGGYDSSVAIPNPYFYRGIHNRDLGEHSFLLWFSRYFSEKLFYKNGKVDFAEFHVLDRTDDEGHFSRYLYRCGVKLWRWKQPSKMEQALNKLFDAEINYVSQIIRDVDLLIIDGEQVPEFLPNNLGKIKYIILRFATETVQKQVCEAYTLMVEQVIDTRWKGGFFYKSYLLINISADL